MSYDMKTALDRRYSDRATEYAANLRGLKRQNDEDLVLYRKTLDTITSKFIEHVRTKRGNFVYHIYPAPNDETKYNWVELHAADVFKLQVEKQGFKCCIEERGKHKLLDEVLNLFRDDTISVTVYR